MTVLGIITLLFLFAGKGGQTPGNYGGKNITGAGNLKGIKQKFKLSDVINFLISVTGMCVVLCPLLQKFLIMQITLANWIPSFLGIPSNS